MVSKLSDEASQNEIENETDILNTSRNESQCALTSKSSRSHDNSFNFQESPQAKYSLSMSVNSIQIIELFVELARKSNFTIIEKEQTIATAITKSPLTFKQLLQKCLSSYKRSQ